MRDQIEKYYLKVITGHYRGFWAVLVRAFLWVFSQLYRLVINLRYLLYRIKIFRTRSVTAWVISVGNITLGGTGKTPVVERLARLLSSRGRKVAIVSRGYRRKTGPLLRRMKEKLLGAPTTRIVSDGKRIFLNARVAGDEPYMLASNLKDVPVLVNRRRAKAALYAVRRFKADTIILDDGFQHVGLKRDLDIVLVDSEYPFGNGYLFPRGFLRERPRHLNRADLVIITKVKTSPVELKQRLRELNPRLEILECRYKPLYLRDLRTSIRASLGCLRGMKICAVAGIARPEGFKQLLQEQGAVVVETRWFPEHHFYSQQELIDIINQAGQASAEALITTEKDAARFAKLSPSGLPVYSLRVEVETLTGEEDFDRSLLRLLRRREQRLLEESRGNGRLKNNINDETLNS